MSAPPLAAEDLAVSLSGRPALREASLAFAAGELTVVIGPNGAGKTTLLRALAGLARPSRGLVRLGGTPLAAIASAVRAERLAYLPQNGGVGWPIPVASLVALGRLPHGESPDRLSPAGRRAVATALGEVGLAGFEARPASELSGGERARALLARALAVEAPILLADEPVAALDPRHQLAVLEVLRRRARAGATVVAVMHDLALAARFADRVALLREGRLAAFGEPRAVLTEAGVAAAFGIEALVGERDGALMVTPWRAAPG